MVAPAFNPTPEGAPMIFPFLFITIACGAVSGFHCLVSSGTSSKQIQSEPDARFVGYGSMLTEGFLATLVILACGAGLGLGVIAEGKTVVGEAAWAERYASWGAAKGLGAKVGAFVDGSANFLKSIGLSAGVAVALMGVWSLLSPARPWIPPAVCKGRHSGNRKNLSPRKKGCWPFSETSTERPFSRFFLPEQWPRLLPRGRSGRSKTQAREGFSCGLCSERPTSFWPGCRSL